MGEKLNQFKDSLLELWNGLDKNNRTKVIVIGVLSIVLIASLVYFTSRTEYEPLYYDLSQKTAGQVNESLQEKGIKTKVEGTTIYVPKGTASELRIQLAADGVINDEGVVPENNSSSFYETSEDKKERYLRQKEYEIEKGLRSLQGVEYASVQLYVPEDSTIVLDEDKTESTAGIIIKMKQGAEELDTNQVNGIAKYVARSVKGLKPDNVEIIDETGRPLLKEQGEIGSLNSNMELTEGVKKNIEDSIEKFLGKVFGKDNVEVTAAVKLNFDSEVVNSTEYVAPDTDKNSGIVRNMEEIKKDWVDAGTGGVPGTDSNTDITEYANVDESKAQYNEASTVINYEINEINKQIVTEQGNIESLTIAILINKDSLKDDTQTNSDVLQQDVKDLVKYATQGFNVQALSIEDNISVKVMDFDNSMEEEIEKKILEEEKEKRNDNLIMMGSAVAAVLILGGAMFVLLRKRKDKTEENEEVKSSYSSVSKSSDEHVADIEVEDNELKKQIDKFVTEKPDQVAQLLKTWINEE